MNDCKNIASILEQSKQNKGGFKLPEDYFDQLQHDVSAKINEQQTEVVSIPKGPGKLVAALLIAASFAMIFVLVKPSLLSTDNSSSLSFAEYSSDEINEYLEENSEAYDLIAFADNSDFDLFSESNELSNIEENSLGDFLIDESEEFDLNEFYSN